MAKPRRVFTCQECSKQAAKWMGRCGDCGAWNSLVEQVVPSKSAAVAAPSVARTLAEIQPDRGGEVRVRTGIGELDEVLGGGIVAGSLILVGGDPGVGKSTLLLMAMNSFSARGLPVLYATGEESPQQVRMRADRLGVDGSALWLVADTDWPSIEAAIHQHKPMVAVIDSVQTVAVPELSGVPGTVGQVREVAHRAMKLAKGSGTAIFLVGHVTKSGDLAGPKVLEHLVDTVLHFEGDGRSSLRVLRAVKNRFGAAGELGMFEMADDGLREVPDASARLLEERAHGACGTAVLCAIEGSRPVLAEVQALVGHPSPQIAARTCVGVDRARVLMLAAVLQKAGIPLHDRDIFVNAAGGLRLIEPATDLAMVLALVSSATDRPVPADVAAFGEVGLVGEVRATSYPAMRLREAARHGFRRIIAPARVAEHAPDGVTVVPVRSVADVLGVLDD